MLVAMIAGFDEPMAATISQDQRSGSLPSFEAASIRPHAFDGGRGGANAPRVSRNPGRINLQAMSLGSIIEFAYDIDVYRIEQRPDWLYKDIYDVVATSTPSELAEQKLMLQSLLSERCRLRVRRVSKEGSTYRLTVGRRLRISPSEARETEENPRFRAMPTLRPDGGFDMVYTADHVSTQDLATWLSGMVGRPVIDDTGMRERFNVRLAIPMPSASKPGEPPLTEDTTQLVPPVLRSQLGFDLEPGKGPVEHLVIEGVQRPCEN